MARVTVEDCVDKVANRFELVLITAQRAKNLNSGSLSTIDKENHKYTVVALKEVSAGHVNTEKAKEELIQSLQTRNKIDQIDEDIAHLDDDVDDKFDYMPNGSDIYVSNDHSDLDNDQMFEVEDTDNEDKNS
ncbi:MAG: DNA-directed RNA polymerase subunit omega [Rickettsiaceae bacterium]|nr:MAG: DNA-directed RNA polymerase subunit omega [Rickettsiaceae bacterium]